MRRRSFIGFLLLLPVTVAAGRRRDNPDECERLDEALKRIESQRRAGYTAKQGRRLLEKRRQAEQKRRELCR
jgi:hypothetical protein